ncbi:MAG TPA: plastocyanin/azurin family copper-binding protein [Solirubrobacterales bacterium]|jgi:plastocyanin|nr:plastocyanin/azurin family copper-binding protein [Solirubrobacterales bacterium]
MDDATLFYVCGSVLAVSAVIVSFLGLRLKGFPGKAAPLVILCFVALVGAATTFAVLNGEDEQQARAAELERAGEEALAEENQAEVGEAANSGAQNGAETQEEGAAGGPGGTLQLEADPTQIAFDTTALSSKPGKVTIDFTNPAALEHDVAIAQEGKQLAVSETIVKGKTSVTADLSPGTYTFLCTVPGHAEAGMEGTLTVK